MENCLLYSSTAHLIISTIASTYNPRIAHILAIIHQIEQLANHGDAVGSDHRHAGSPGQGCCHHRRKVGTSDMAPYESSRMPKLTLTNPFYSTGIGFATLRLLAQRGAKVYFTSRSESNARKAVEKLRANHPDIELNRVQWLLLDLADLKSIDAAANELRRRETKLHILSMPLP